MTEGPDDVSAPAVAAARPERATRRWLRRGLVAIGLGLMGWLISHYPLAAILDACRHLGAWVFVTPLIALAWFAASSTALYHLLDGAVPWRALIWNRVVGEGYNALLPAAGVGGEPIKLRQLTRYVDSHRALVALINDRLLENAIALAVSAACVGVGAARLDATTALRTTMWSYAIGAGVAAGVLAVLVLANLTSRIGGRLARWIGSDGLGSQRTPRAALARAFVWALLARGLGMVEIALLLGLLGVTVTPWTVLFTSGALTAAGFVGGVIPQNLGVAEAATVGVFQLLHFAGPAGVAFALARRGRMLLVSVLGIVLHLATRPKTAAKVD